MTTPDLKTFESALRIRARNLLRSVKEREEGIVIERASDALDEMLLAAERESSAQILTNEFRMLCQVQAARARIRDGTFGTCLGCKERIATKRLHAIPWATYCVSCQTNAEEGRTFPAMLDRVA